MKVAILTTCRSAETLYGSTLIFGSLRVGFPTARVVIYDNGSSAELSGQIERRARDAGCEFVRGIERLHGDWMQRILDGAPADEPLVFLDADVVLWKNCEPLVQWADCALFAGRYIPEIHENGSTQVERIHPSFLIVPNPGRLRQEIDAAKNRTWYLQPFHPFTYFDNGDRVIVDTAASLYSAFRHLSRPFGEEQLGHYDHLFAGGMLPEHAEKGMAPGTLAALGEVHDAVKRGDLESLRGLWRKQELALAAMTSMTSMTGHRGHTTALNGHDNLNHGPTASWTYLSGRVVSEDGRAWGVSVANFCLDAKAAAVHATLTNLATGQTKTLDANGTIRPFHPAVDWNDGTAFSLVVNPSSSVVTNDSVRYGTRTTYLSAPNIRCSGSVMEDGKVVAVCGDLWMDYESLPASLVRGWDWLSMRLDDGRRIMLYGPHGGSRFGTLIGADGSVTHLTEQDYSVEVTDSYMSEASLHVYPCKWRVRVAGAEYDVKPYVRDQEIPTGDVRSSWYWEGACRVTQNGREVGYAFAELTGYRELNEAEMGFRWAKGNKDAVAMMEILGSGSHLADDLVDEHLTAADASEKTVEMLSLAMGTLPNNRFYRANRAMLEPLVMSGLVMWHASNTWTSSDNEATFAYAFVYRNYMEQLLVMVGLICGGLAWARQVAIETHLFYHGKYHGDQYADWKKEIRG